MKTTIIIIILAVLSLLFLHCHSVGNDEIINKTFKSGRFDLDSNLVISYPSYFDSIRYLEYPSYEIMYYKELSSKDKQEYMLIERLKFNGEKLDRKERTEYFINGVYTDLYDNVQLLNQNEKNIQNRKITSLVFRATRKKETFYPLLCFFYHPDSSFTTIEMRIRSSDSAMALKEANYILNSIDFIGK